MKLDVPYYSQYLDVADEGRKLQACAIACLKMVLDFYGASSKSIDDLFMEGEAIGGMTEKGWKQDSIVALMHNHGVSAYREEFRSNDEKFLSTFMERGKKKIMSSLLSGNPVFVSVFGRKGGFHLVLFVGVEMDGENIAGFYYHDPEREDREEGKSIFMTTSEFEKGWRRLAIFPYKMRE